MPPPSSNHRPSLRSRRKGLAAVVLALVRPWPACAAGKRRGVRRSPNHDDERTDLPFHAAPPDDEGAAPRRSQPRRTGAERAGEVVIRRFTAHLLATNFPYQLKYRADNELSGAVAVHVASHLSVAFDGSLIDLGLNCTRFRERIGPEVRWAVECAGAAAFGDAPGEGAVNDAVRGAFSGAAEGQFLEAMYPRYELVREKRAWDAQWESRGRRGNGKKQTNKMKKKPKKKKDKKKPVTPKKQKTPQPSKKRKDKKKKKKNGGNKPKKQKPSKPQRPTNRPRPSSPGRPISNPFEIADSGPQNEKTPSNRDIDWLNSHNSRRKQWHTRNNRKYVPLKWSDALKEDASAWARHLAAAGQIRHDANRGPYGENLAMRRGGDGWPTTDDVLTRWVEQEVNLKFPGHLTQVLWRATKWVGCADARSGDAHVQVCRYARPGNCNMADYSTWLEPVLMDESPCGASCHPDDC